MDDGIGLPFGFIFAIVLLLLAADYFAVCETSVSACSRTRMKSLAERGNAKAERVLQILDRFETTISTISICTNIVHIAIATVTTVFVTRTWGAGWVSLSTVVVTVGVFFLGEMLPKSIAKKTCDRTVLRVAGPLLFLMKVFSPFSRFLSSFGSYVSAHTSSGEPELSVTEDEIYDIIEDMTEEGTLDEDRGELISSALQFADVTVESILTPRVDVVAVDVNSSSEQVMEIIRSHGHSRLPVYEGSVDNITGVLQIRKFIRAYLKNREGCSLKELQDPVLFVHASTNLDELLPEMTRRRMNLAVVTDNYGGTMGIVTVEDILEELVGEIWDEEDVVEETVTSLGNGVFRVDAEETVSDVLERLDFDDPEDDEELVNTLMSEWAFEQFPSIPEPGAQFEYHGLRVTVAQMEHNRILSLDVEKLPEEQEGGSEE